MANVVYYGCVVLSSAAKNVLLVKPKGCDTWCFPFSDTNETSSDRSTDRRVAASRAVGNQAGINVHEALQSDVYIEAEFPPGSTTLARLYIAYDFPRKKPVPSDPSIEEAAWKEFRTIMEVPDSTPFDEAPVKPFLKPLREWIVKQHHLRVECDEELARLILFNGLEHKSRVTPKDALTDLLRDNAKPAAIYRQFRPECVQYTDTTAPRIEEETFACMCDLPHLNVSITPEFCYFKPEEAEQMASMAALLYLLGTLDEHTVAIHLAPIGSRPPNVPFWNEEIAAHVKYCREGALLNGSMTYWHDPGHNMIPRRAIREYKHLLRTPVTLVEEFCTKNKHEYKFEYQRRSDGYVGLITVRGLGFNRYSGELKQQKREAKEHVCSMFLSTLKEKGLYVV